MTGKYNAVARKQKALPLLLEGRPIREVAESVGVREREIYRWLEDPLFKRELHQRRKELLDGVVAQLQSAMNISVQTLVALLKDESAMVRLRAANGLLGHAVKYLDLYSIQERLDALEAKVSYQRSS
ncbi:hypothetical protein SCG7086_AW_00210 [Chlamydiales bacterium SCGC AG-110-P3]|nr:hypothetical protein SCG7086_AW_00210 [Chlamydiales bacterium SCGC AG-110-P3]